MAVHFCSILPYKITLYLYYIFILYCCHLGIEMPCFDISSSHNYCSGIICYFLLHLYTVSPHLYSMMLSVISPGCGVWASLVCHLGSFQCRDHKTCALFLPIQKSVVKNSLSTVSLLLFVPIGDTILNACTLLKFKAWVCQKILEALQKYQNVTTSYYQILNLCDWEDLFRRN